jgi:hypothetical protein
MESETIIGKQVNQGKRSTYIENQYNGPKGTDPINDEDFKDGIYNSEKIEVVNSLEKHELTILWDKLTGVGQDSFEEGMRNNFYKEELLEKKVRRLYLRATNIKIENEIKDAEKAQKLGELLKADIVIWGNYNTFKNEDRVNLNFKIIKNNIYNFNQYIGAELRKELSSSSIKNCEGFRFMDHSSKGINSIFLFILGILKYYLNDFNGSKEIFNKALLHIEQAEKERKDYDNTFIGKIKNFFGQNKKETNSVFNKQIIHFYLGNCY